MRISANFDALPRDTRPERRSRRHKPAYRAPRKVGEGLRIGTVRRPPRGVPKAGFASRDFYDVWLPMPSPSVERVAQALRADDEKAWKAFERRFRAEMNEADASRVPDLIAALSHTTSVAIGCNCQDEARCHRSVLRDLLTARESWARHGVPPATSARSNHTVSARHQYTIRVIDTATAGEQTVTNPVFAIIPVVNTANITLRRL